MSILDLLDIKSRWGKLRLLGNSSIAQSTIAVPVLGYFMLFNFYVVEYLQLHTDFCRGAGCGVSWRLYFLYFGCFFVAVGASIYGIACPTVAKIYPGASDFFEAEKAYFSGPSNLKYLFELIEKAKGAPAADPFELNRAHTPALADIMGEYYVLQNTSKRPMRILCFMSYCAGIGLILVPALATFIQVFAQAVRLAS